jgi:hypothetical protein
MSMVKFFVSNFLSGFSLMRSSKDGRGDAGADEYERGGRWLNGKAITVILSMMNFKRMMVLVSQGDTACSKRVR